jgi:hypothetical protein
MGVSRPDREWRGVADAGVGDNGVDAAELGGGLGKSVLEFDLIRHIGNDGDVPISEFPAYVLEEVRF